MESKGKSFRVFSSVFYFFLLFYFVLIFKEIVCSRPVILLGKNSGTTTPSENNLDDNKGM